MNSFLSIKSNCESVMIIKKSKFITNIAYVEDEQQALNALADIRQKYADATHNCYAYITDTTQNTIRFSDDGEPQKTAGIPILQVLKDNKLFNVLCVVSRYFGGIKLGSGGLVRAYRNATCEAVRIAQTVDYVLYQAFEFDCKFENQNKLDRQLANLGIDYTKAYEKYYAYCKIDDFENILCELRLATNIQKKQMQYRKFEKNN